MNEIVINLDVRDKKYFVSKYNDDVIDPELSSYIMNYMIGTSLKDKVTMKIECKFELTEEEKDKYSAIIKKEFKENIDEIDGETYKSNVRKFTVLLLGTIFIALSYFIDASLGHILSQILTVFGWVALWEVAYAVLFGDAKKRRNLKRYKQLYNSKIEYVEKK